jgi:hypothetical protein
MSINLLNIKDLDKSKVYKVSKDSKDTHGKDYIPIQLIDQKDFTTCENGCCPSNNCACIPNANEWSEYLYWDTTSGSWEIGGGTEDFKRVHIGLNAGITNQATESISIGYEAGNFNQGITLGKTIAIGSRAGRNNQAEYSIAIGADAGFTNQQQSAIAIGLSAGRENQVPRAVAIGNFAGYSNQGEQSIAIGYSSGVSNQNSNSVAIGTFSGYYTQGEFSIAIGYEAGLTQGCNAVAIGYGAGKNQASNSIVINAANTVLNNTVSGSCRINPIRQADLGGTPYKTLLYNDSNGVFEVVKSSTAVALNKSFIIQHPTDTNKYLQHVCLEGPEAGVYYRGKSEITNDKYVIVELPNYVDKIAKNFTVHVNRIIDFDEEKIEFLSHIVSNIKDNKFKVFGKNGTFDWVVYGERHSIEVEPSKADYTLHGDGPYTYITKN